MQLETIIAPEVMASTLRDEDAQLAAWVEEFQLRFGPALKAVVLYGSYTRGARDSLTDFYVLIDSYRQTSLPRWHGWLNAVLPPNVYQSELTAGAGANAEVRRCKYALLPLAQFERRLARDFHSYFWARFAQPCQVLYCAEVATQARLLAALGEAVRRFHAEVGAVVDVPIKAANFWEQGLALTYGCELRTEAGTRTAQLVEANRAYCVRLTAAYAAERDWPLVAEDCYRVWGGRGRVSGNARWVLRRFWGKALSVLRLSKAALTFNDGLDYLLWKIERHSGIYIEPSAAQRRFPLLCAWPLFYRLYRLGAFR